MNLRQFLKFHAAKIDSPLSDFCKDSMRDPRFPLEKMSRDQLQYLKKASLRNGCEEMFQELFTEYVKYLNDLEYESKNGIDQLDFSTLIFQNEYYEKTKMELTFDHVLFYGCGHEYYKCYVISDSSKKGVFFDFNCPTTSQKPRLVEWEKLPDFSEGVLKAKEKSMEILSNLSNSPYVMNKKQVEKARFLLSS